MPMAIPLVIAAVVGGMQAAGVGQPNQDQMRRDQAKQIEQANLKQKNDETLAKQQAMRRASPDIQSQTGGNLGTPAFAAQVASATGNPGDIALAQKTLFQGGGEGTPASDPGLTGLRPNAGGGGGSGLTPTFEHFGSSNSGRDLSGSSGSGFDISKIMEMFSGHEGGGQPEFQMHDMLTA